MMITTAAAAPMRSPKTYTHKPVRLAPTMSGPSVRAGFIDEPLIGLANRPSIAIIEPTAMAALWPMLRPPVAVQNNADQDRRHDDLHDARPPVPAGLGDRIDPASSDIAEDHLQEQRSANGVGERSHLVRQPSTAGTPDGR
jgi:hypothetical protein